MSAELAVRKVTEQEALAAQPLRLVCMDRRDHSDSRGQIYASVIEATFECNGRQIVKAFRRNLPREGYEKHLPEGVVAIQSRRTPEQCEEWVRGEFAFKACEAYRDFLMYAAKEKHGDSWRSHYEWRHVPPFHEMSATVRIP